MGDVYYYYTYVFLVCSCVCWLVSILVVYLNMILLYRVSINSFPYFKHLLQENYVKCKHIFFLPLLKLVSKIFCHVFIIKLQKNMFVFHVVFL